MRRLKSVRHNRIQKSRNDIVEESLVARLAVLPHGWISPVSNFRDSTQKKAKIGGKLLTGQNLPNSQVTKRVGLRLILPCPRCGGKSSDLGFDLLPRSLGIVAIKYMGTVCLEN